MKMKNLNADYIEQEDHRRMFSNYSPTMDDIRAKAIYDELSENGGSRRAAAETLGMSERTLHRRLAAMRKAGVNVPEPYNSGPDEGGPKRGRPRQYSNEDILGALREADGHKGDAADLLGCSVSTMYSRLEQIRT